MPRERIGVLYGLGTYLLWGFTPLYFAAMDPAPPIEVLAFRIVGTLAFLVLALALLGRLRSVMGLRSRPRVLGLLALSGLFIGLNWWTFIWAVSADRVVESSLGYYINPLVTMVLGVVVLRERLRPVQWSAVAVATVAVAVLTVDYGRLPWVALSLAGSFGFYGLLKKQTDVGGLEGIVVESALLLLPAVAALAWLAANGRTTFASEGSGHFALLATSGAVLAVPLLLFGAAVRRIPLVTMGLLQYLAPTITFVVGVRVLDEPLPPARLAGFGLVWVALAIFTVEAIRHQRQQWRLPVPAPTL